MSAASEAYNLARTIASTLIANLGETLTTEKIRECVEQACSLGPTSEMSDQDKDKLSKELESIYQTVIGEERALVGEGEGWDVWLPARRATVTWDYWKRYEQLLAKGSMGSDVLDRLEISTDRVLGFLGDPGREGPWDRRGLVVGLVQSGKTSHYIGLANKALDAGYKVIVILTGFTESLRVQTQIRTEDGLLGYSRRPTRRGSDRINSERLGVGLIDPRLRPDSGTTKASDFKKTAADTFGIHVGPREIIFVVKKNVGVLRNLLEWIGFQGNAVDEKGSKFVRGVPLLVIDDESDVGSIDTRKGAIVDDDPDPDHEPSRINQQIRKLLALFEQSSYVGYTATPFANVLIHDGGRTEELGDDLFPRSFIVALPTPSNHVGPAMVFGYSEGGEQRAGGLPIVRHIPDTESGGELAWVPPVHRKWHRPEWDSRSQVPPSLREALLAFVLACAARRVRGAESEHNSMLVHVTRFNDVQALVKDQVERELKGIVDRLRAKTADKDLLREIQRLWERDFSPTTVAISSRSDPLFKNPVHEWQEVEPELLEAAAKIQVRTINGLAAEVLDYDEHEDDGLSVVAIGGDKLSRGLTLHGLSVSYFLRCSRMYDTLMQMGRWFGYRPGYLDLCRLYTTPELCEWFEHIATATEELRGEFDLMVNSGATPKDFGLRVRSHPDLLVTSQVKMRHGETIHTSFQGKFVETDSYYRDATTTGSNYASFTKLVERLVGMGVTPEEDTRAGSVLWKHGIVPDPILSFLDSYLEHDSATKARTKLLREYIEKENLAGRLRNWSVLISGGSGKSHRIGSNEFKLVNRGWKLSGSESDQQAEKAALIRRNQFRIGILINPPDERLDLEQPQVDAALEATIADWKRDPRGREKKPKDPAGRFLRQERDPNDGLLIIYPLQPTEENSEDPNTPLVGFVISFPAVPGSLASTVSYTVNNVYQTLEMD